MWKNNILPCILALATVSFAVFMALQFVLGDKPWNFAVLFFTWVKATPFGSWVGDFVYAIDLFLGGALCCALKKWMRNLIILSSCGMGIAYWAIKIQEGLMFHIVGGISIFLATICVVGCAVIGLALKRGQENVNKIVRIIQN